MPTVLPLVLVVVVQMVCVARPKAIVNRTLVGYVDPSTSNTILCKPNGCDSPYTIDPTVTSVTCVINYLAYILGSKMFNPKPYPIFWVYIF